ncbi:MAG: hypothetical protein QHC78_12405 [Pigmentiphaga sp.]|uniref:hypothetical protein n=1 Tax=Pigmentiphaga sp. TaxID=1977564 RepID=UPI0029BDCD4B|nr:hypothetical protein [Pigmentiphaga sp.]MDX3906482.1 hypothetical protein [Pigmentiphaga sp.]
MPLAAAPALPLVTRTPAAMPERLGKKPPVPIGHYWPGEGGVYAGTLRADWGSYHLIVPLADCADLCPHALEVDEALATSVTDGLANTRELLASHAPAREIAALEIDGHQDFYIPSKRELAMCEINLSHLFMPSPYWSSTQCGRDYAWALSFDSGAMHDWPKTLEFRTKAVRRVVSGISTNCNNKHQLQQEETWISSARSRANLR